MKIASILLGIMLLSLLLSCEKENTPPQARFTVSPEEGNNETTFTFDASGCTDLEDEGEDLVVIWDYESDGNFDSQFASRKTAVHVFSEPGDYLVTLVVKDTRGLSDTALASISAVFADCRAISRQAPMTWGWQRRE